MLCAVHRMLAHVDSNASYNCVKLAGSVSTLNSSFHFLPQMHNYSEFSVMLLEPFMDKPCGIILLKKTTCRWIHCCHEGRHLIFFRYPVAFKHCSAFIKRPNVCPENTPQPSHHQPAMLTHSMEARRGCKLLLGGYLYLTINILCNFYFYFTNS
jgi:hypothetical protein